MKALLDTHAFLWWVLDNGRLSEKALQYIRNPEREIYLSTVTGWEIAIKYRLKKIALTQKPGIFVMEHVTKSDFLVLPIHMKHALRVADLPDIHEDPFDRLLIAQAQTEKMSLVTADRAIKKYDVDVIW